MSRIEEAKEMGWAEVDMRTEKKAVEVGEGGEDAVPFARYDVATEMEVTKVDEAAQGATDLDARGGVSRRSAVSVAEVTLVNRQADEGVREE